MTEPRMTLGTATFRDFPGLYMTLQSIRLHHPEAAKWLELVVVDNDPDGPDSKAVRDLLGWIKGDVLSVKYVAFPEPKGTAAPRDEVFRRASAPYVTCVDSHVMFPAGVLMRLIEWFENHSDCRDLISGPMIYDDLRNRATHFADVWRGEMWGTWASDPRGDPFGKSYSDDPFEIPAMGLGMFACRKDAWLGFHPDFRAFGGEEFYIHGKYRKAGRKCLCLPWATWLHRFGRPGGVPYPIETLQKVRNYVIGHRELEMPLDRIRRHFVEGLNEDGTPTRSTSDGKALPPPLTVQQWESLLTEPAEEQTKKCGTCGKSTPAPQVGGCQSCNSDHAPLPPLNADAGMDRTFGFEPLIAKLSELSNGSNVVVDLGLSPQVSTVALLAGEPANMVVLAARPNRLLEELKGRTARGKTNYAVFFNEVLNVNVPECDLLVIDTVRSGTRLSTDLAVQANKSRRWVAVIGTHAWGGRGEDGGPGLMAAVRNFLHHERQWTATWRSTEGIGMVVLSRSEEDKKRPPGLIRKGLNFTRALAEHVAAGKPLVDDATFEARLDHCMVCEHRNVDVCSKCGCPVDAKARWSEQECPDDPPRWLKALSVADEVTTSHA